MLASSSGISPLSGGEGTRSVSPKSPPRAPGLSLPGARYGGTPTDLALEEEDLRSIGRREPCCPDRPRLSTDRRAGDRPARVDRRGGKGGPPRGPPLPGPHQGRRWGTGGAPPPGPPWKSRGGGAAPAAGGRPWGY